MGLLTEVTEDYIVLETKTREPKKIGKGKETVIKQTKIDFQDIKETIVTIISK
jgi:ribosome maturation factor RimP